MPVTDSARIITVTLSIAPDGEVSLLRRAPFEAHAQAPQPPARERPSRFEAPFDADYAGRKGYQAGFLGGEHPAVLLPRMRQALEGKAAPLLAPVQGASRHELRYHNFSVVMHARRRLAIFSAANVSAGQRFQMSRPADQWRLDPRIDDGHQLGNFYYKGNRFDRGHLTRREDLEFGASPTHALQSAADTCHWTNCVPQQERFNQGTELWQGLERYVLEEGVRRNALNIQVFTGPVFEEDDPVYERFPEIQYPVRFWKVIAAPMPDGRLSATGYLLDQSEAIAEHGIEAVAPFGNFNNFQVPLREIEELTQLQFEAQGLDGTTVPLRGFDPLDAGVARSVAGMRPRESALVASGNGRYHVLSDFEDIILQAGR